MLIKNNNDLRDAYQFILDANSLIAWHNVAMPFDSKSLALKVLREEVIDVKRGIRKFTNTASTSRIVKDSGIAGYIELIRLPDFIISEYLATFYFVAHHKLKLNDCDAFSAKPFTCWYKIIKRRGKFFVYHGVSYDV